jgi:transcriptional regulator
MGDAPQPYLTAMLGQIVGIEIPITRIIGKLKASQNRSDADAAGAIAGLRDSGDARNLAMADIMASTRRSD